MVFWSQCCTKPITADEGEIVAAGSPHSQSAEPGATGAGFGGDEVGRAVSFLARGASHSDVTRDRSLAEVIGEEGAQGCAEPRPAPEETGPLTVYARALEAGLRWAPERLGDALFRQVTDTPMDPAHLRGALRQVAAWREAGFVEWREFDIEPLCPNGPRLAYRAKVAVYAFGEDTGEDRVLCLTGYQANVGQMGPIVEALRSAGRSVLMFDWDGHGLSAGGRHQTALQMWGLLKSAVACYYPSGRVRTVVTHSVASHLVRVALAKRWFTADRHVMIAASHPKMATQFEHIFRQVLKLGPAAWPRTLEAFERHYGAGTFDLQDTGIPRGTKVLSIRAESDRMCPGRWEEAYAALHAGDDDYQSIIMKGVSGHNLILEDGGVAKAVVAFI